MAIDLRLLDCLTCRQVLNIMVILGFMLNYMLRVNLTIAIVSMVIPEDNDTFRSSSFDHGTVIDVKSTENNATMLTSNNASISTFAIAKSHEGIEQTRYPWNEYEINLILGSFFWGYICTELPGGRLAETIGAKRVFGYSMLVSSAITLLTPACATRGYVALIILRSLLGFMLGATWPAIQPMSARWIPPTERSKFISNMLASSLGAAVTMPVCGYLIDALGWESVFYLTGAVGLAWSLAWFLLIFDSPADHPRISIEEREYIEDAIGASAVTKGLPVPWKPIFRSAPVWAIVFTHACSVFGYFTVINQLPTYMKYILNFNIKENGLFSSLPYLGKYMFAVATSTLADHLLKKKKLSVTAIRKIFTSFAVICPALLMFVMGFCGRDRGASVTIFTLALTTNGAVTAGYLCNGLDIAPNFSGTIFGMANTVSSLGGYLSTYMVGTITYKNQTFGQWRIIFWVLMMMYTCAALVFTIFGSGELQEWNSPTWSTANKAEDAGTSKGGRK